MIPLQGRVLVVAATARLPAEGTALGLAVWAASIGAPGRAGLLIAVATFPQLVTGPWAGRLLDGARSPEVVVAGAALVSAIGCVLVATSGLHPGPAVVGALALAASAPALTGGLSSVVMGWGEDDTALAAWDSAGYNGAGLLAPVVVTVAGAWAPWSAFLVLAVGPLLTVPVLLAGRSGLTRAPAPPSTTAASAAAVPTSATAPTEDLGPTRTRDVLGAIAAAPRLLAVTVATTVLSVGLGGLEVALVAAVRAEGLPVGRAGVLATAVAVGALVGSLALARWRWAPEPAAMVLAAVAGTGGALAALAVAPGGAMVAVAVVVGLLDAPLLVGTYRARSAWSPRHLRAGVFTVAASLKLGAGSLGAVGVAALVGDRATAAGLVGVAGVALLAAGAGVLVARRPVAVSRRRPTGRR